MSESITLTLKLQKVLDSFSDLQHRIEKQTSYLENFQSEGKTHETWSDSEVGFTCYEEDESHKYPHLFHTMNPQLNNISCMIAYMIKKQEKSVETIQLEKLEEFYQRIEETLEEQKRSQKRIDNLLELLEDKNPTQGETSQILQRGEDRGKAIVIPEIQTQPKEKTSESKQLSIRPPSTYF